MIQEIKIKNFLSFKDEIVFSLEASNNKFADDYQVVNVNNNTRLLRFAIIYGYNASGKTNLIRAFDFLTHFWFHQPKDMNEATIVTPFKLDIVSSNEPSKIELVFWVNNMKYWYCLELDKSQVYYERLDFYKVTKPYMLFERTLKKGQSIIEYGSSVIIDTIEQRKIAVECLKNMSFFAARSRTNVSIPILDDAINWLRMQIMDGIMPSTDLTRWAQRKLLGNPNLPHYLLEFLKEADFNITGIDTNVIEKPIDNDVLEILLHTPLPQETKDQLSGEKSMKRIETIFEHTVENSRGEEKYLMAAGDESRGTMRTFGLETALYTAIKNNAFLPVDEIETSLHPKLLEKMLFDFFKSKSQSQLIITTHNDGLLDLVDDLFRKDTVWFTEKNKSGGTEIYKLIDFRGINRLASIREAYRNKRFGATMK